LTAAFGAVLLTFNLAIVHQILFEKTDQT